MDAQIHGAIVGGILGGVVVAASIITEHRLEARRARRRSIEAAALELSRVDGLVGAGLVSNDLDRKPGSTWSAAKDTAFARATEIRLLAKGKRWRPARVAADRYLAALGAAWTRVAADGKLLPLAGALELTTKDIMDAVFGSARPLTAEWQAYQERWDRLADIGPPAGRAR